MIILGLVLPVQLNIKIHDIICCIVILICGVKG